MTYEEYKLAIKLLDDITPFGRANPSKELIQRVYDVNVKNIKRAAELEAEIKNLQLEVAKFFLDPVVKVIRWFKR